MVGISGNSRKMKLEDDDRCIVIALQWMLVVIHDFSLFDLGFRF